MIADVLETSLSLSLARHCDLSTLARSHYAGTLSNLASPNEDRSLAGP